MSAAKRLIKHAVCVITALAVFFAAAPAACSFAADAAERWENEMAGAAFATQAGFDGRGVRVAVIDSGAAPLDALGTLAEAADYTGGGDAADSVGHGTFIAGIIAGSDAESGYRGAAPGAEIVSLKCFNSDNAGVPAAAAAIRGAVDVYGCRVINLSFGDGSYMDNDFYKAILTDRLHVNEGMFVENVVAQCLRSNGHKLLFYVEYDAKGKPLMEIDFLIRKDRKVVPVEAKSGKSFAVKSLHNFKDKFTNRVGLQYVLHDGDIKREGEIVYLPYYMASVL